MSSFLEKLKKGMGVEETVNEEPEEEEAPKKETKKKVKIKRPKANKVTKMKVNKVSFDEDLEEKPEEPEEPEEEEVKESEEMGEPKEEETEEEETEEEAEEEAEEEPKEKLEEKKEEKWFEEAEGQLAIDVYQTESELVIQSAVAGIKAGKLDIFLEKDVLTIKGQRERPYEEKGDYFFQECFWGSFSREVILPVEVDPDKVSAKMQDGILTIRIPKILREKKRKIAVSS